MSELTPEKRYVYKPYPGSSHTWALERAIPWCQRRLESGQSPKILDVGSGSGAIGQALSSTGMKQLYAVEPDPSAREHGRKIYTDVYSSLEDVTSGPFDLILLLDVLEHIAEPEKYFSALVSKLEKSGCVIISVPNIAHWSIRLSLLMGIFNYTSRGLLDRTHLQFFTRARLLKLIGSHPELRIKETGASIVPLELLVSSEKANSKIFSACRSFRFKLAQLFPGLLGYQHLAQIEKI